MKTKFVRFNISYLTSHRHAPLTDTPLTNTPIATPPDTSPPATGGRLAEFGLGSPPPSPTRCSATVRVDSKALGRLATRVT